MNTSCNAFQWVGQNCEMAQLTSIGDNDAGPTSNFQLVMVLISAIGSLTRVCSGGEHCCHMNGGNLCTEGQGDCNEDRECAGLLECGQDNCISEYSKTGGLWDPSDDCCRPRCTLERPCGQGEGPCIQGQHQSCQAPGNAPGRINGGIRCSARCTDRQFFPVERFPNNSASQGLDGDIRCCRRECYPTTPCEHAEWGCEVNADCQAGLECVNSPGKELGQCLDYNECLDSRFTEETLLHCGQNTTCTNSIGSFSCPCNTGYTSFVAGVGCSDFDECDYYSSSGASYCGSHATCTN